MNDHTLRADTLRGIAEIADFLGETERRVYYQAERGMLPLFKRGAIWYGRKSTILAQIEHKEHAVNKQNVGALGSAAVADPE